MRQAIPETAEMEDNVESLKVFNGKHRLHITFIYLLLYFSTTLFSILVRSGNLLDW